MAKVVKFPTPVPEKFGPLKVRTKKLSAPAKASQLNLFTGGKIVKLNPLTPFEEALLFDENGDKKAAREQYLKAVSEGDSTADAYCNVGIIETQELQYARAIDCFTRCLKADPRHYEAHYNLANLYSEVGNFALAKLHYETAIEIEPSFTNAYFNLALALAMNKDFKDAVRILMDYRSLTPVEDHKLTDDLINKLSSVE